MPQAPRRAARAAVAALAICLVVPASALAGGNSKQSPAKTSTAAPAASATTSTATPDLAARIAVLTTASCPAPATPAFATWGDPALYSLIPGGSFEGLPVWSLFASSPVVGNEPWHVNNAADKISLAVLAGGSATSPSFCASLSTPTLRFFARADSVAARLKVEILYTDPFTGALKPVTIGTVSGTTAWAPTSAMLLQANLLSVLSADGLTELSLRLTATSGTWQVDDVYVDPFRKG